MTDFRLIDFGSVLVLEAMSEPAQNWAEEHLPDDRLMWGRNGTVVEPRYVEDILDGIQGDGLTVS